MLQEKRSGYKRRAEVMNKRRDCKRREEDIRDEKRLSEKRSGYQRRGYKRGYKISRQERDHNCR